jgi:ABC-type transport system involved in multi-copper enzyme maturation permease subunit
VSLLRAAFRKLWRRPASWVVGLILIVFLALVYLAFGASARQITNEQQRAQVEAFLKDETAFRTLLAFLLGLGGLLSVAYAGAVAGAEWSWGTLRVALARGESRTRYLLTLYVAVGVIVGIGLLISYAIGAGLVMLSAGLAGISTSPPSSTFIASLPELLARAWLGLLELSALGFAIATVARSQLAGIGAGIALYVAEQFVSLAIPDQARYLPFSVSSSLVITQQQAAAAGTRLLDTPTAFTLTVTYGVIALLIAVIVTERAQIAGA